MPAPATGPLCTALHGFLRAQHLRGVDLCVTAASLASFSREARNDSELASAPPHHQELHLRSSPCVLWNVYGGAKIRGQSEHIELARQHTLNARQISRHLPTVTHGMRARGSRGLATWHLLPRPHLARFQLKHRIRAQNRQSKRSDRK
eukprot:1352404-Pleurochrysis_carterae.AAC.1